MKTLGGLLQHIDYREKYLAEDKEIAALTMDSRQAGPGTLFFAIRGTTADGHRFIAPAEDQGAAGVVCEVLPPHPRKGNNYILVEDSRRATAQMAAAFYGFPARKLDLVGITGTNGKTTVATLLYHLVRAEGHRAGLLSTVGNYVDEEFVPSRLTTPDPITINHLLGQMVKAGCSFAFMEVSSHAAKQKRIDGLGFAGGIFTNITHDHLDYHPNFKDYLYAKKRFFDLLAPNSFALVNADDKNSGVMLQNTKARSLRYGRKNMADYGVRILERHKGGMLLELDRYEVFVRFSGDFNADNLLAVYAAAVELGIEKQAALATLSTLRPVRGRFETVEAPQGITAIIDYAHTPDALENVFRAVADLRTGNETLISLVGAGGDRDKSKRPKMAGIAARHADKLILTSDNPRTEDPNAIINDMAEGIPMEHQTKTLTIPDRREAIKTAVMMAQPNDIILIPGKGHETYQEVDGVRHHFDDRQEVIRALGMEDG